jgi:transcriptional regulator with XRE-family HTH domain
MTLKQTRKGLGLTLQQAADAVGLTREGVRLAENGDAPKAAISLNKFYRSQIARRVRQQMKSGDATITFKFFKRGESVVCSFKSIRPFVLTDKVIDALLDGFVDGNAQSAEIEF